MQKATVFLLVTLIGPSGAEEPLRVRALDGPVWYVGQAIRLSVEDGCPGGQYSWASPEEPGGRSFDLEASDASGNVVVVARRAGRARLPSLVERCPGETVARRTQPLVLQIEPVPRQGRQATFLGGVGPFEVRVSVEPAMVDLGASVMLTVQLTGPGAVGVKQGIDVSSWLAGEKFLRVEPLPAPAATTAFERKWSYQLRPSEPGTLRIPSLAVSSFDPKSGLFITQRAGALAVEVAPIAEWRPPTVDPEGEARAPFPIEWIRAVLIPLGAAGALIAFGLAAQKFAARSRRQGSIDRAAWARRELAQIDGSDGVEKAARKLLRVLAAVLEGERGMQTGVIGSDEAFRSVCSRTGSELLGTRASRLIQRLESLAFADPAGSDAADARGEIEALWRETGAVLDRCENRRDGAPAAVIDH
jgi:hypothetical protein